MRDKKWIEASVVRGVTWGRVEALEPGRVLNAYESKNVSQQHVRTRR